MLEIYDFKLIKSGRHIEVYDYRTKKIIRGYHRKKRISQDKENKLTRNEWEEIVEEWGCEEEKEKLHSEQKQKTGFSISRTRTNIRRLVNANQHLNQFLTLTFAQSMPDLAEANKLFDTAMKRIIRARPEFEYIAVVEFQKDVDFHGRKKEHGGSVHYHLLCNMPMKEHMTIEDLFAWEKRFALKYWQNGFVKIKEIKQVTNIGAYFCKYLGKDMFDKRMFGKKKFFCSRTLNKPVELTGSEAVSFFNKYVQSITPTFEKTFSSEYAGKVDYSAYALNEDVPVTTPRRYDVHRSATPIVHWNV